MSGKNYAVIGKSVERVDARAKVTGEALYPGDINLPDQAYMKILFANHPHAIIKAIDTAAAEALPGVLAVFTAKDVPVNEYGLIMNDQPVLCGPGSSKPFADRVRFIGDQVALVLAESEEIAAHARDLIQVEYEDLPVVTDVLAAMNAGDADAGGDTGTGTWHVPPDQHVLNAAQDVPLGAQRAPLLHPDKGSNIFGHYRIRKGDVEAAFAHCAVVVEGEYHTPAQEHAFLQPEAGIAYFDEAGRVTVQVAGQWTHEDQEQIAHALDLPLEQVRVIYPSIGGAFGGREDMSVQIVLALAVWRLQQRGIHRPVKIVWSREESIIGHHKRHPYLLRAKWGGNKDGKLVAARVEIIADGGAYAYTTTKVMGNATLMCTGPYEIPHVSVDSYAVYTNNLPNGAFRGFGGPQAAFAAEMQMNHLAEALGMDPIELRQRNLLVEGALLSVGTPLPPGVSIGAVVEKCVERMQQSPAKSTPPASPAIHRGTGFACAFKNVGFSFGAPEQCTATVELHGGVDIERAILHHAGAEVGQGTHTVMRQFAAETLGIPLDKVQLVASDTAVTENSGSVSASRMTFMAGNSIKGACERALLKWKSEERPAIVTYQYRPPKTTPYDPQTGKSEPNFAYGYVAQAVTLDVDTDTGEVHLVEVISANDVGQAVNPQQVQGQIEGGVVQAAGYAVTENFIQKDGYVLTDKLSNYLIPTVLDVPDKVQALILEYPDPIGPYGARGMGEMPFLPLAPAVVAAVHAATGVWFHEFPLTPEKVLRGLGKI